MQIQPPVYESLMTRDEEAGVGSYNQELASVKRRPLAKSLRNRLSQIVSTYIPASTFSDRHYAAPMDGGDHTGLLTPPEHATSFNANQYEDLYSIKQIHKGIDLLNYISRIINLSDYNYSDKVIALATDQSSIYVGLEDVPFVFILSNDTMQSKLENPVKAHVRLHSPGIGDICPKELCVHSTSTCPVPIIYVVGVVQSTNPNELKNDSPVKWILCKFNLAGKQLARSRVFDYQRYSGLSIDTIDNQLLLACPSIEEVNQAQDVKDRYKSMAGQVCKLTPGFERRVFSITMGKDSAIYKPNYVTQESAGHYCWASVERWSADYFTEINTTGPQNPASPTRRLLAFPGRQPGGNGTNKQSAKEWLSAFSWDFAELRPGRVAAFDEDRVLVTDSDLGTLSYIAWSLEQDKPSLYRITRPSINPIRLLCTTYNAQNPFIKPMAYFVAGCDVYSFEFKAK